MGEATAIHQDYINHGIAKQKRHKLLDTTILRGLSSSCHCHPQHLTNLLRAELEKNHIISAAEAKYDSWLFASWYLIPHHGKRFFDLIILGFYHLPLKVQHIIFPAGQPCVALLALKDVRKRMKEWRLISL